MLKNTAIRDVDTSRLLAGLEQSHCAFVTLSKVLAKLSFLSCLVFLLLRVYLVGVWSKTLRSEYNLKIFAISALESAVMVRLSPTGYPANASTACHPAIPLASHLVSCYKN